MIFKNIETGKDINRLKRDIVNDPVFYSRILKIREKIDFKRGEGDQSSLRKRFPTNAETLALYRELVEEEEEIYSENTERMLRKIKTKSNSGIVSVSVLTKPFGCPGNCLYCPTEKIMPKSYLSKEPAAARALGLKFNPYKQVMTRLRALETNGHNIEKIEVIIIGATWSSYKKDYQEKFVSELFRACNEYGVKKPSFAKATEGQVKKQKNKKTLEEFQKINEKANHRIIGMSIETRPDCINLEEIKRLRELGVTKVEMGVQHLDNKVLEMNNRGIRTEDVIKATRLLRQNGFKIVYHMMLNLYGSTPKKDIMMFKNLFGGPEFQPDMLKIYPCVLLAGTGLEKVYREGKYKLYSDKKLQDTLIEIKKNIPEYVRIMRVIRDIPAEYILAGSKVSNMRQFLAESKCRCIRCREIREEEIKLKDLKLKKIAYDTSAGEETFLSWNHKKKDKLVAFLRLLLPTKKSEEEILPALKDCALIREVHTYGRLKSVSKKGDQGQHRGLGRSLIEKAEKIAKKAGYDEIAVISGVGVRNYYRKLGYRLRGTYMVKSLA